MVVRSAGFSEIFNQWLAIKSNEGLTEVLRTVDLIRSKTFI